MSPPEILLLEDFDKPLHDLPLYFDYEELTESRFFYNHIYGGLFKFKELKATEGSEFSGCLEVYCCQFNEMALDGVCAVAEDFQDPYEGATAALKAGFDIIHEELIGRYAFKDFIFYENEEEKVGKQIKGAYIHKEYQQFKIATLIYKYLAKKYGYLISDNNQTYQGHMLWVLSVLKWSKVRSYDCVEHKFISIYDPDETSPDFKPWSVPYNFPMDKEKFLTMDLCVRTDIPLNNVVLIANSSLLDELT